MTSVADIIPLRSTGISHPTKSASWLSRLPATNKKFYLLRGRLKEYITLLSMENSEDYNGVRG
jgi:hypothetical protein